MRRAWLLIALSAASCSFEVRGFGADDGGVVPAGGGDGPSQGCDPAGSQNHCSPDGTAVVTCAADGSGFTATTCAIGCVGAVGSPACGMLAPSGAVLPSDVGPAGVTSVTISADTIVNADDGSITGGLTRPAGSGAKNGIVYREAKQAGGPNVAIFSVDGLTIAAGAHVTFTGKDAVAFVSSKDVSIAGSVSLVGACASGSAGPGAGDGGRPGDANNGDAIGSGAAKAGLAADPLA